MPQAKTKNDTRSHNGTLPPTVRPKAGARNQPGQRATGGSYANSKGRYPKRVFLMRDAHGLVKEILQNEKLKLELQGIGDVHEIVKYFAFRLYKEKKKKSLTDLSDEQLSRLCKVLALVRNGKLKINEIREMEGKRPPYKPMEQQIKELMKQPEPAPQADIPNGKVITLATAADIQRLLILFNELQYTEEQRKRFIDIHTGKYVDVKQIRSKAHALHLVLELGKVKAGRGKYARRPV